MFSYQTVSPYQLFKGLAYLILPSLLLATASTSIAAPPGKNKPKQLVNLKDDLKEKNNLLDKNPAKVKELTKKMGSIILNGGSKPNKKTSNDGPKSWAGIKWVSEQ